MRQHLLSTCASALVTLTAVFAGCSAISAAPSTTGSVTMSDATTSPVNAQPGDEIDPQNLDRELLAKLITRYTNEEREERDLQPLRDVESLQQLARKHSQDMAKRDYFSHTAQRKTEEDISFSERVSLEALGFRRTAENLALQPVVQSKQITTTTAPTGETTRDVEKDKATYEELARSAVEGWMKSPGHRKNILTPEFGLTGVGFGIGQRDNSPYVYVTQLFGQK